MSISITPEQIGGVAAGFAAVVYALKRMGIWSFGKSEECPDGTRKMCVEHGEMRLHIEQIVGAVKELKEGQRVIESDIKELLKRNRE